MSEWDKWDIQNCYPLHKTAHKRWGFEKHGEKLSRSCRLAVRMQRHTYKMPLMTCKIGPSARQWSLSQLCETCGSQPKISWPWNDTESEKTHWEQQCIRLISTESKMIWHLLVTPAQFMRPGICQHTSCVTLHSVYTWDVLTRWLFMQPMSTNSPPLTNLEPVFTSTRYSNQLTTSRLHKEMLHIYSEHLHEQQHLC